MIRKNDHPTQAADFVKNKERAHWHDQSLWFVRSKRDKAAQALPEWETLRETAQQIKLHTVSHLADYLEKFENRATQLGATVHWAKTAEEHNAICDSVLARDADLAADLLIKHYRRTSKFLSDELSD